MTQAQTEPFGVPSLPKRPKRLPNTIEYALPLDEWLLLLANTGSTHGAGGSGRINLPPVTFSCDLCETIALRPAFAMKKALGQNGLRLFCSKTCAARKSNDEKGLQRSCVHCGKHMPSRRVSGDSRTTCSDECLTAVHAARGLKQRTVAERPCEECGAEFRPASNKQPGRFCCRECKDHAHAREIAGENNPGWRHGLSPAREAPKVVRAFFRLKAPVYELDGFKCVTCGSGENSQFHHVNLNPLDNRMENLVTLCQPCHMKLHAAERSEPKTTLWPWLSEYAKTRLFSTSKSGGPSASLQTAS